MMQPFRIAVFASGNGSNFQAIVDAVAIGKLDVSVELLVCDRPQAKVVKRAEQAGVPTFVFRPQDYASRERYEVEITQRLEALQVDLIVMAGYMRLITDTLVQPFYGRIINVHPSLLPAFPGVKAIEQAFESGVKVAGITVHYVDGGMDTGPIIAQRTIDVDAADTEETLAAKLQTIEHELFPQVIRWISEGQVKLEGRQVSFLTDQKKIKERS